MILAATWHIDDVVGSLVKEDAIELVRRGQEVIVLYPWHSDEGFKSNGIIYQPVAITMKNNTNIVTSVLSALADFSRVFSTIIHEVYDPCKVKLILSYEWSGAVLGYFMKKFIGKPMVTSVHSVEDMRTSEKSLLSLSVRGLEIQSLYRSDLVIARTNEAFLRILRNYRLPDDRVKIAASSKDISIIVEEFLR